MKPTFLIKGKLTKLIVILYFIKTDRNDNTGLKSSDKSDSSLCLQPTLIIFSLKTAPVFSLVSIVTVMQTF